MTHELAIRPGQGDAPLHRTRIRSLQFTEGLCFALKA